MRKLVEVQEVPNEGFEKLLGQTLTLFCLNYIYTGKLVGINEAYVLLESPSIVYETGAFHEKTWRDAQQLPHDMYVMKSAIEAFGLVK